MSDGLGVVEVARCRAVVAVPSGLVVRMMAHQCDGQKPVRWSGNGDSAEQRSSPNKAAKGIIKGTLMPGCRFSVAIDVMDQFGWQIATDSSTQVRYNSN
jgi:hypothetical protein